MNRVLHLPTAVGNHGYSLACEERKVGYESDSMIVGRNNFNFKTHKHISIGRGKMHRILNYPRLYFEYKKISNSYDVLHFNFSKSLIDIPKLGLEYWDLERYPSSIIKVATHNGSDVRDERAFSDNPYSPFHNKNLYPSSSYETRRKKNEIFHSHMQHIFVLNPDLLNCVPSNKSTFLPYIKNAWHDKPNICNDLFKNKVVRIVHAPTNRDIKGSDHVIAAVDRLKNKGYNVELVLIEGLNHKDALKCYATADIVVDQLRVGWYGGFALEVARLRKPVITYIHSSYLNNIKDEEFKSGVRNSFISATPETIFECLEKCITDTNYSKYKADQLYDFVEYHHDPQRVIKQVTDVYQRLLELRG